MDEQSFDSITRAIGTTPRRSILRLALAGIAAAIASRALPVLARQDDSQTCAAGETICPAVGCVDLQTDLAHCGACDTPCTSQLVAVDCRNGECVRADCPPELEYCGPTDLCRDLQTDPAHCGACMNVCASGACAGGVCTPVAGGTCAEGQAECDGVCIDTCCNNQHCGACGNACTGGKTCFEGICDCPSGQCCAEGEILCGDICVATCCNNDHCGACGNACPAGQGCFEGICGCPRGDCGPITPPGTGVGPGSTSHVWPALSAAAAAVFAALNLRTRSSR